MGAVDNMSKVMEQVRKGTTTVGVVCKDGVVLAADRKATAAYIENRYETKVFKINENVAITTAGMVGDLQYLTRLLKVEATLQEIRSKKMTAKSVATLLSNILQGSRYYPYMVGLLVAGKNDNGYAVYSVDAMGGATEGEKIFTTGSGGPIALGVLQSHYQEGLSTQDGLKLAIKALKNARERDPYTGGMGFNAAVINDKGCKIYSSEELDKLN